MRLRFSFRGTLCWSPHSTGRNPLPVWREWPPLGNNPCQSTLPPLLAASQSSVPVHAAHFIFNDSQYWTCQCPSQSAPRFGLARSQSLKQQLLMGAKNIVLWRHQGQSCRHPEPTPKKQPLGSSGKGGGEEPTLTPRPRRKPEALYNWDPDVTRAIQTQMRAAVKPEPRE